jgi:hypothetical protein
LALAAISGDLAGFYFLGSIGAGFIFTYLQERKHWWAVIPGGVLVTLGTIVAAEEIFPRWDAGGLFFAGLAATFGYLYAYERKRWAIYPAVALLVIGLLGLSFTGGWVFPLLLIAVGFYALKRRENLSPKTSSMNSSELAARVETTTRVETATPLTVKPVTAGVVDKPVESVESPSVYAETLETRELPDDEGSSPSENEAGKDSTNKDNS